MKPPKFPDDFYHLHVRADGAEEKLPSIMVGKPTQRVLVMAGYEETSTKNIRRWDMARKKFEQFPIVPRGEGWVPQRPQRDQLPDETIWRRGRR